jgi:serine/threonine protein kinase
MIYQIFLRESCVWSTLSHPNITPLLGVVFDFDQLQTPCLVSPYYMNGHIQKYIENHPGVNKLALVSCMFTKSFPCSTLPQISQIASGLEYMHARSVIHGDIKPVSVSTELPIVDFLSASEPYLSKRRG